MRYVFVLSAMAMLTASAAMAQTNGSSLTNGKIFEVSFESSEDVGLFSGNGDGWIYTADSMAMKTIKKGNHIKAVKIAKGAGRFGDALHFTAKTKQVLVYKGTQNEFQPKDNWAGTVSVWLKLDPDKDLPSGFCDPLQITSKKWNDASFFIDFDKTLPRDFRLGVFSDYKFWNPTNTPFEKIPLAQRPMVTVKKPPFASDKWTHVVFTFANVNSTTNRPSLANLYLDGKIQGSINRPLKLTWDKTQARPDGALIMLGINYVGYMDELGLWRRALSSDEVQQLYKWQPKMRDKN